MVTNPVGRSRWIERQTIRIDCEAVRVYCLGRTVHLALREFKLLCHLAERPGAVFCRSELRQAVWPPNAKIRDATVDTYIFRIRTELAKHYDGCVIQTIRGQGYRFIIPHL